MEGDIVISRAVYKKRRGRRLLTTFAAIGLLVGTVVFNSTVLAVHDVEESPSMVAEGSPKLESGRPPGL